MHVNVNTYHNKLIFYYCIAEFTARIIFCEWPEFCSQKKYLQFLNIISTAKYIEDIWSKNVLALIFANAFLISKYAKLSYKFLLYGI